MKWLQTYEIMPNTQGGRRDGLGRKLDSPGQCWRCHAFPVRTSPLQVFWDVVCLFCLKKSTSQTIQEPSLSGFVGSTYITCCFIWTITTGWSLHSSRCRYSKQNVKVLESHMSSSPNIGSRIGKYHFSVWSLCEWLVSARAEKRKQPHTKQDP